MKWLEHKLLEKYSWNLDQQWDRFYFSSNICLKLPGLFKPQSWLTADHKLLVGCRPPPSMQMWSSEDLGDLCKTFSSGVCSDRPPFWTRTCRYLNGTTFLWSCKAAKSSSCASISDPSARGFRNVILKSNLTVCFVNLQVSGGVSVC